MEGDCCRVCHKMTGKFVTFYQKNLDEANKEVMGGSFQSICLYIINTNAKKFQASLFACISDLITNRIVISLYTKLQLPPL